MSSANRFPPPGGLLLGWESAGGPAFGFAAPATPARSRPIVYAGDNHLITFAPTGAGKGVGALIPAALTHPGPLFLLDVKGEAYQVAARRRRELGQRVAVLDPFGVVTPHSDGLNPLDLFDLPGASVEADAEMIAAALAAGHEFASDRYWNDTGTGLVAGLIAHVATTEPTEKRNLNTLRDHLHHDDLDYQIAVWLDAKEAKSRMVRDEFVAYLAAPSDKTRPCIRSTAMSYVKALASDRVAATLARSTFDLAGVVDGQPLSIFLVIPPDKLESHRSLLRLWVGTLLTAVARRRRATPQRTLFLIDECAQLGELPVLRQALTLLRGYGLQCWTFFQDISQLRRHYKEDWQTLVNNSGVLQTFGLAPLAVAEWATLLGVDAADLRRLPPEDELLVTAEAGLTVARRPDYRRDPLFRGLYDANPRFTVDRGHGPG